MARPDRHGIGIVHPWRREVGRDYLGIVLLTGLLFLCGCRFRPVDPAASGRGAQSVPALAQSDTAAAAPDFSRRTLEGRPFRLSDHRGQVVVLNFWATWCGPCRVEIPDLVDLQQRFGDDGLLVVGVAAQDGPTEDIRAFGHRIGINYPVIRGGPRLLRTYGGVSQIPTTYVIDPTGRIRYGRIGRVPPDTLTDVAEDLLGEHPPQDAS